MSYKDQILNIKKPTDRSPEERKLLKAGYEPIADENLTTWVAWTKPDTNITMGLGDALLETEFADRQASGVDEEQLRAAEHSHRESVLLASGYTPRGEAEFGHQVWENPSGVVVGEFEALEQATRTARADREHADKVAAGKKALDELAGQDATKGVE